MDGLSACDCKQGVTNGVDGQAPFDIATGCYRCAGSVTYGITASTGCYVSDSVSIFLMNRAQASRFHTGRGPLSPTPVVTLPTRPRLRSLPLLLFPYQYHRALLV